VLSGLNEWYLFPQDLASGVAPSSHSSVQSYIDALVAPARALRKDRFFTYITSIAEENAFFSSGASAGFGVRLSYDTVNRRLFVMEAFENAPALAAGIDRGTEITAIGTTTANLVSVSSLFASGGAQAVADALGPSTAGTTRVLRIITGGAPARDVSVTKATFDLTPVSSRYGAQIIQSDGRSIGYINLRTFISSADTQLRTAFANFRTNNVTELVIDFRYNGGGLVSTANLMGDLMGRNQPTTAIFSRTDFRPEKAAENDIKYFAAQVQSIAPTKIAFIGTGSSASASELVINSMRPYLGNNVALIGSNTFGKPVGQIALDRSACDDRLRVVAFATGNANSQSDYYDGLAPKMSVTCRAADDIGFPLGDPREASMRTAIDFLVGRPCAATIAEASAGSAAAGTRTGTDADKPFEMLRPDTPSAAQHEVPGLF
jgi:C-terminal processing protease CtpA/Prc